MNILNYLKINDHLQTSGQPKADEFKSIAEAGVNTVINLAMPDSDTAIANEGELVSSEGMNYIHIPVVWQQPKVEQFELFAQILEYHKDKSVWVHCALNWRVSSFIYLYRTKCLIVGKDEAWKTMEKLWTPNEVWSEFIETVSSEF
jgi:protein tyrosine phosphatase (PTP) superfamily phosphohydrolase (DUF442 family)